MPIKSRVMTSLFTSFQFNSSTLGSRKLLSMKIIFETLQETFLTSNFFQ